VKLKEVVMGTHDVGEGLLRLGQLVWVVIVTVNGVQEMVLGTQETVVGIQ
jgi:hypothetical protein